MEDSCYTLPQTSNRWKNQLLLVIAITALHFPKWIYSLWNAYLLLGVDAASGGEGGEKKLVPFFCLFSSCINLSSLCCCSNSCSSSLDRRFAKDAAKKLLSVPKRKQNHTNLNFYRLQRLQWLKINLELPWSVFSLRNWVQKAWLRQNSQNTSIPFYFDKSPHAGIYMV